MSDIPRTDDVIDALRLAHDAMMAAVSALPLVEYREVIAPLTRAIQAADAAIASGVNSFSEGRNAPLELQMRTAEALDAERYRYLRNAAGQYMADEDGPTVCSGLGDLFEYHFGPEVDEVVDAAIARWKADGCPLPKEPK